MLHLQAGGNINDFQNKTYARIQLSKASEYYPGTSERTLLVTGHLKHITAALSLIFDKLLREGVAPLSPRTRSSMESREEDFNPQTHSSSRLLIRFLVPQALCGIIIGRGGSTIKNFSTETQTQIRIAAMDSPAIALSHRIVNINGTTENILKAVALLVLKQTEDLKFPTYSELPSNYLSPPTAMAGGIAAMPIAYHGIAPAAAVAAPVQYSHPQFMAGAAPGTAAAALYSPAAVHGVTPIYASASPDGLTTITFAVTEDQATVLLGQDGHGLDDIQSTTGVRIQIIQDAQDPQSPSLGKPTNRVTRVVVTGSPDAVQYCHYIISQKLMNFAYQQQYAAAAAGMFTSQYHHPPNVAGGHYGGGAVATGFYQYRPQYAQGGNLLFSNMMDTAAAMNGRRPSPRTMTPRQHGES